ENSFTGIGYNGAQYSRGTIRDSVASSNAFGGVFAQGENAAFPPGGTTPVAEINVINTTVAFNFFGVRSGSCGFPPLGAPPNQTFASTVRLGNTQVLSNSAAGLSVEGNCVLISLTGNLITGNAFGNSGLFNGGVVATQ